LFVMRFFLGVFEAGILPVSMVITASWYPRKEHAVKTAAWFSFSSLGSACGGLISYAIQKNLNSESMPSWGYLMIIEGGATVLWGILSLLITPDKPEKATFLTPEEKLVVVNRLALDRSQTKPGYNPAQLREAFVDPKTYVLILLYFW
jgi:MFS family permease